MQKKYFFLLISFFAFIIAISVVPKIYAQTSCQVTPTSADSVTATVTISQTGNYKVWNRILAPDVVNNSYFLQIDNGCAVNIGDAVTFPVNTWAWVDYKDGIATNSAVFSLTAGDHTVTMTEREGGVGLDRLLFTTDLTCVPNGLGESCQGPTITPTVIPTATVVPTAVPTPTRTPTITPTPLPGITASSISMTGTKSGSTRTIKTTVTVRNTATLKNISGATVFLNLKSPQGTIYKFNGSTNTKGQVIFTQKLNLAGVYQATITNITKTGYTYYPTNTVKSIQVN